MSILTILSSWKWLGLAIATSLGAYFVYNFAWHAGYNAQALGLLGFIFLRSVLLLLAWLTVVAAFLAASENDTTIRTSNFTLLHLIVLILIVPACVGCFPLWPFVLVALAVMYLTLLFARRGSLRQSLGLIVVRPGLSVALFVVTWYLCSLVAHQAFLGLGTRIEEKVGAEKLKAWAAEVVAEYQQGEHQNGLEPDQIPDFVNDLLGPFQGVRSVGVEVHDGEPCVALFTGGSAFHFRILVCPSQGEPRPPDGWFDNVADLEWRPGIRITTEGK